MPDFTLQIAKVGDAGKLSALTQRVIRISNAKDYGEASAEFVAQNFAPDRMADKISKRHTLMCFSGEMLIGTGAVEGDFVKSLFIDPDHQGKGAGALLMSSLESFARHRGIEILFVDSSITAMAFYLQIGYELIRFEDDPNGATYLMQKAL